MQSTFTLSNLPIRKTNDEIVDLFPQREIKNPNGASSGEFNSLEFLVLIVSTADAESGH